MFSFIWLGRGEGGSHGSPLGVGTAAVAVTSEAAESVKEDVTTNSNQPLATIGRTPNGTTN